MSKQAMQMYFAEPVGSTDEQIVHNMQREAPSLSIMLGSAAISVLSGPEAFSFIWDAPSLSIMLGSAAISVLSKIPFP